MKRLTAILQGCKLVDKLFGLREKEIRRTIEAAKDECEEVEMRAQMVYETSINKLGEEEVCYADVLNSMIEAKSEIMQAQETRKIIEEIEKDLDSEVKTEKQSKQ